MGLLSTLELRKRLVPSDAGDLDSLLVVTPLINLDQVSDNSIDLRLGNHFTLTRTTRVSVLDAFQAARDPEARSRVQSYQRQVMVPYGAELVLHPGDFVLGTTVEYVRLPMDLTAYVMGRSSWGRLGLIIATAVVVHPGFAGCITLELANESAVPIVLRPGTRICQLTIHRVEGELDSSTDRRYMGQVLSEYSRIYEDKELQVLSTLATGA